MTGFAVAGFFDIDIAAAVTALAAVLTAVAAGVALGYARRELIAARETARIDRTFRLYEHQLNPEFARHMAITSEFLTIDKGGDEGVKIACERWRRWREMSREEKFRIILYPNLLEVVGDLYELEHLHEDTAMRLFGQAADEYWTRADWFVGLVRGAHGKRIYTKWETLAIAHRSRQSKSP